MAPDVEKCTAGVQLEAGFKEAVWLDDTKVLVGLDTGDCWNTLSVSEEKVKLNLMGWGCRLFTFSLGAVTYYTMSMIKSVTIGCVVVGVGGGGKDRVDA